MHIYIYICIYICINTNSLPTPPVSPFAASLLSIHHVYVGYIHIFTQKHDVNKHMYMYIYTHIYTITNSSPTELVSSIAESYVWVGGG